MRVSVTLLVLLLARSGLGYIYPTNCCESALQQCKAAIEDVRKFITKDQKLEYCAMGMKSGEIKDSAISSSSQWDRLHAPSLARLDNVIKPGVSTGSWSARPNRVGEWIQVDLGCDQSVAGVITQGRPKNYNQWVTSFKVKYRTSKGVFTTVQEDGKDKIFQGNTDTESHVINMFPEPVNLRYFRLYPHTFHNHMSMRMELIRGDCADEFS